VGRKERKYRIKKHRWTDTTRQTERQLDGRKQASKKENERKCCHNTLMNITPNL